MNPGPAAYVYFPTTCIVSLLYVMEDGASAEIAVVGNEGILGISLFMGGETTPSRAIVQSAGHAYRLRAELLKDEFERFGPTMHLLLRYTQALITQMAQTAVCNRHHSVDQQLCRWLLLSLDRLPSNELAMTQELIANMLGVRREGVTEAAGKLQDAGLIHYRRGRSPCSIGRVWRRDAASATRWSRRSSIDCCPTFPSSAANALFQGNCGITASRRSAPRVLCVPPHRPQRNNHPNIATRPTRRSHYERSENCLGNSTRRRTRCSARSERGKHHYYRCGAACASGV